MIGVNSEYTSAMLKTPLYPITKFIPLFVFRKNACETYYRNKKIVM